MRSAPCMKVIAALAAAAVIASAETKGTTMDENTRGPVVAGQFYQADPQKLRAEIEGYLDRASPAGPKGEIAALISPHAGYVYSGPVAAWGYSLLEKGQFETVVVISPSHTEYFPYASVFDGSAYVTPLGSVEVDAGLAAAIAEGGDRIRLDSRGHVPARGGRGEHALEVQIPFLQVALGEFRLVPIVMGDQSREVVEQLGDAVGEALGDSRVLIVASTDLSHFHDRKTARRLDDRFMRMIEDEDAEGLLGALSDGSTEACGGGPSAAAILAARSRGPVECSVLRYADSGDVTGDTGNVVGYVSAVIARAGEDAGRAGIEADEEGAGETGSGEHDGEISRDDRIFLLRLARHVIASSSGLDSERPAMPGSEVLGENRGGFVTLRKQGRLRGCIGYITPMKPLAETVEEMSYAAAFRDMRFPPVKKDEVEQLTIEVSVLSPVRQIDDPGVIEVGRHGIILSSGGRSGLLLPQVAEEYGWDRETFLDQTCLKAGLPPGAWKDGGTKVEIFSAEVFSEEDLGLR